MKKAIKLDIPFQLELLCNLMDSTTEDLLQSFIEDACRTLKSNGHDEREIIAIYLKHFDRRHSTAKKSMLSQMLIGLDIVRYERHQYAPDKEAAYKKHARTRLKRWYTLCQREKQKK